MFGGGSVQLLGDDSSTVLTIGANGGSSTFSGAISGSGKVTKAGSGMLALSGTNIYAGPTTVNAGTLRVDGSLSGNLVLNGGTLSGSGTVGAITTLVGGAVAPGNGPGVLTASSVTFNATATLNIELNGPTPGNGPGHNDLLLVNGQVNLGGANLTASLGYVPDSSTAFTILQSSGTISGSFAQSILTVGGRPYQVVIDNSSPTKTVTLVPVPPLGANQVVDVTGLVSVSKGKAKRKGSRIKQAVTLTNTGTQHIQGPISLVLDRMTKKVKLRGASGKTAVWAPLKCFYANLMPSDGALDPGESLTYTLEFILPTGVAKVRFTPRVLAGVGPR